jgi:helix-turn-helix protein
VSRTPATARRLFDRFEPIHAVTYFAPESRSAFDGIGLRGFWTGYFAARSAPLGRAPAEVVTAVFYNFSPAHVARALPAAWESTSPADALRARETSAVAALRRCGVIDDESVRTAADLLAKAAACAPADGRPLFAANQALPWPDEPVARLWHASTLLREQRGDAHVALLVANGLSGRDCNVLHSVADRVPRDFIMRSRQYDDEEWGSCSERLAVRGIVDAAGALTDSGRDFKRHLEDATDGLALRAFDALDDAELDLLFGTLTPITRLVIDGGDIPAATPMGLRRDDLDDDGAHLD